MFQLHLAAVGKTIHGGYNELIKYRKYHAIKDGKPVTSERNFCSNCSTMLWLWDEEWPELIHPFVSAIDTKLPMPKEMVCIMEDSKPDWVRWPEEPRRTFKEYNKAQGIAQWHKDNDYCDKNGELKAEYC